VAGAIRGATDGVPDAWLERVADRARIEPLVERVLGA
jgi:hypothetical protein